MASQIIGNFISQPFYTEMRTNQQLGYIVLSAAPDDNGQLYLFFIVQSQSHPADEIRERANPFITGLADEFEALPEEIFNEFKAAVRTGLLEKPKSIAEKTALFDALTFEYNKDFDRRQKDLDALDSLTKEQVGKILADALAPEKRKIVDILLFAKQHSMMSETAPSIESIDLFKTDREFVARPEK
jgi:insulysin